MKLALRDFKLWSIMCIILFFFCQIDIYILTFQIFRKLRQIIYNNMGMRKTKDINLSYFIL